MAIKPWRGRLLDGPPGCEIRGNLASKSLLLYSPELIKPRAGVGRARGALLPSNPKGRTAPASRTLFRRLEEIGGIWSGRGGRRSRGGAFPSFGRIWGGVVTVVVLGGGRAVALWRGCGRRGATSSWKTRGEPSNLVVDRIWTVAERGRRRLERS